MKVSALVASFGLLAIVHAQKSESPVLATNGTVLAVFVYHNHCDRASLFNNHGIPDGAFGAAGAIECYTDGMVYHNRYLKDGSPLKIFGTSETYDGTYVDAEVFNTEASVQSAMSFLQGVYRPIDMLSSIEDNSDMENSTWYNGPLGGYQYATVTTYKASDPNSIWVGGNNLNCPVQQSASNLYYATDDYKAMFQESKPFYDRLWEPYFQGVFDKDWMYFFNAWPLYDYVKQNRLAWNKTLLAMPDKDFNQLGLYASHLQFNLYANTTTASNQFWTATRDADNFREVNGRLIAGKIARTLRNTIAYGGEANKFNLVLGGFDVMLSFFAIANLTSRSDLFYGLPDFGSSMVFELYTDDETLATDGNLTASSVKVAFGFQNGTTRDGDTLTYWPLFDELPGNGPASMQYLQFLEKMDAVSIESTGQWCSVCRSEAQFCQMITAGPNGNNNGDDDDDDESSNGSSTSRSGGSSGMAPAVAGVIGAIIMLAIVGIASAIAFFVFGVGIRREKRRSSVLSGIGSIGRKEQLSSEIELPLSPTAAPMAGARRFEDDEDRIYDTFSSTGTKVASPLASPEEAHFKNWEARL